jgi:hypothetical protein
LAQIENVLFYILVCDRTFAYLGKNADRCGTKSLVILILF